jgi:hypothetical protein
MRGPQVVREYKNGKAVPNQIIEEERERERKKKNGSYQLYLANMSHL